MYNNEIATVVSSDAEIACELNSFGTKYIAFRFVKANFNMSEIAVYGSQPQGSIISGLNPVTYTATNSGETSYNWTAVRTIQNSDTDMIGGYDTLANQATDAKELWDPFLAKLTDNNSETGIFIQPERHWEKDDVLAIYKLPTVNINGFKLVTGNPGFGKTIKVYASGTYSNLFNSKVAEFTTTDGVINFKLDTIGTNYLAFIFVDPGFQANELKVYGDYLYRQGDVNCDNTINVFDVVYIRKVLLGSKNVISDYSTNVNGDQKIDVCDLVRLKKSLLRKVF